MKNLINTLKKLKPDHLQSKTLERNEFHRVFTDYITLGVLFKNAERTDLTKKKKTG